MKTVKRAFILLVCVFAMGVSIAWGQSNQSSVNPLISNLSQIKLAISNYADANGHFPANAIYSNTGEPLLSWRVAILPYLGYEELFNKFNLNEPWYSPHNLLLISKMPQVYRVPNRCGEYENTGANNMTPYLVFTGINTAFQGQVGIGIQIITDGTNNTVMVVQASKKVPWTKPEDIEMSNQEELIDLLTNRLGGFYAAFFDGTIQFLTIDPESNGINILEALLSPAGNDNNLINFSQITGTPRGCDRG